MTPLTLPASSPPVLLVVIDTEGQFDWEGDFDRNATDVSAIVEIEPLQALFDSFGIRPTYVVDYPMATDPLSVDVLGGYLANGRAELGIHLHTWVNPPYTEVVNRINSYQGNLPAELEREKLQCLADAFVGAFGQRPRVHKAGRYGWGKHTAEILESLDIGVDLSIAPAFDFGADGGPDYSHYVADVHEVSERLISIPTTGAFIGPLRRAGPALYAHQRQAGLAPRILSGVLSRTRLLERIMLSPEGHSSDKLTRLTRELLTTGRRVVTFSFHSSSVRPGATTYVQSEDELQEFIVRCRRYFEFFFSALGGVSMTATEVEHWVRETHPGSGAGGAGR